jgi:acetyl esterase/lipase
LLLHISIDTEGLRELRKEREMNMSYSAETYTYKTVNGCALSADLYHQDTGEQQPVLVWLHGGALIWGSRTRIDDAHVSEYVRAGYTVIALDYRLAPETPLSGIIEDLRDGVQWIRQELPAHVPITPERLVIVGHSAGGYLALLAGYLVTPSPQAIISWYGYGDIVGAWYSRPDSFYCQKPPVSKDMAFKAIGQMTLAEAAFMPRFDFYVYCRQHGLWPELVTGRHPDHDAEWFRSVCPLHNITPEYPPTLLLHGDQDTDVPYAQSVLLSQAFMHYQVPHALITMPNYGHVFDQMGNGLDDPSIREAFTQVLTFLHTHTEEGAS